MGKYETNLMSLNNKDYDISFIFDIKLDKKEEQDEEQFVCYIIGKKGENISIKKISDFVNFLGKNDGHLDGIDEEGEKLFNKLIITYYSKLAQTNLINNSEIKYVSDEEPILKDVNEEDLDLIRDTYLK